MSVRALDLTKPVEGPLPSDGDLRSHIGYLQSVNEQINQLKQDAPPVYLRVKTVKHNAKVAQLQDEKDRVLKVIRAIAEAKYPRFAFGNMQEDPDVMINQLLDILGYEPVAEPKRFRANPFRAIPGAQ